MNNDAAASLRADLLGQLYHLIEETEASLSVLTRLPDAVLETHVAHKNLSVKELYACLASFDQEVVLPLLERIVTDKEPSSTWAKWQLTATDTNAKSVRSILERVQRTRKNLLFFLENMPSKIWTRTCLIDGDSCDVYGMLHLLIVRNTEALRTIAHHLYR